MKPAVYAYSELGCRSIELETIAYCRHFLGFFFSASFCCLGNKFRVGGLYFVLLLMEPAIYAYSELGCRSIELETIAYCRHFLGFFSSASFCCLSNEFGVRGLYFVLLLMESAQAYTKLASTCINAIISTVYWI